MEIRIFGQKIKFIQKHLYKFHTHVYLLNNLNAFMKFHIGLASKKKDNVTYVNKLRTKF